MFRHARIALTCAVLAAGGLSGCDAAEKPAAPASPGAVAMREDGGVYVVPVSVNGTVTIECIVDSGAADVNIPADAFRKLLRAGTVKKSDFLGTEEYTLADGSTEPSRTFRIRTLKVGNFTVQNVVASIGGTGSSALLGQSFLGRFKSWSLDNTHHTLMLLGPASAAPAAVASADEPPTSGHHPSGTHPPAVADSGDGTTVAQVRSAHAGSPHEPDPTDDRLTAQHSESQ